MWVEYLGAVDEFRLSAGVVAEHLADEDLPEAELALEATYPRSASAADAYRKIELEGPEQIVSNLAVSLGYGWLWAGNAKVPS